MTHFIAWNNKIDVPVELSIHSTFNVESFWCRWWFFLFEDESWRGDDDKNHDVHSTFNVAELSPFDVGDDFSDSRTNPFEEGDDDMNHGVPTEPITQPKAKKIQQAFILHLQNWIG